MPDLKISEWDPADELTGNEIVPLVQDGQNRRSTTGDITASAGGLPTGGTTGQILSKASGDNYDTEWVDAGDADLNNDATTLSISAGVVTVNLNGGKNQFFNLTLTENVTGWTFDNKPGSGKGGSIWIAITQASTPYTVAVPSGAIHTGGEMPTGNGAKAALAMTTTDNWATMFTTLGVAES